MALLFNLAGEIIEKLDSQIFRKIGRWGFKDDFEDLRRTISAIQAVLLDVEEKSAHDTAVKFWLDRLREVAYDVDDLLDELLTEALRRQVMDGKKVTEKVSPLFLGNPVYAAKMRYKIKAIKKRLADIDVERKFLQLESRAKEKSFATKVREQSYSSVPEVVIGREDDKKKIIEFLLASNYGENISVISIVGIGGLGKTTLAKLIFDDKQVTEYFELKWWVCVSDPFDVKMIVKKIMESVTHKRIEDLELGTLEIELTKKINNKKYLLVLDDVWNENKEKWENLKRLLMVGASGSKILVTTRLRTVAEINSSAVHDLKGLSSAQSWSLFSSVVFKGHELEKSNVKSIGEKIVEKCVGVPIAIKTIAGLLCFKNSETEWQLLLDNELSKISQDETDILPTLKLSYDNLPSHLKHCFAYCALFPIDYVIDVKMLIHLWIAQGFVESSNKSQCVEDVAFEYFIDLWWRSFFQEVKRDEFGNVVSCKMHDLMHDLATLVAGTEIKLINLDEKNLDEKTYHLSIGIKSSLQSQKILNSLRSTKKIRTFLLPIEFLHDEEHFSIDEVIFSKFRHLRACDVHGLGIEKLPPSIKRLKQLRYIDVSMNSKIGALPNSLCELYNLQVLNVSDCRNLKELPKDIRKLINLRHLYNERCVNLSHMPRGIGELTWLQTLSEFVVGIKHSKNAGGLNELNSLNNLRGTLEIRGLENVKSEYDQLSNLKEMQHLQSLVLLWKSEEDFEEMSLQSLQPQPNLKELRVEGYGGKRFPNTSFSSLRNLVRIGIVKCHRCEHLPPLYGIPSLQKLEISELHDLEYIEMEGGELGMTTTFFPSLKYLSLRDCPKLIGWLKKREVDDDSEHSTVTVAGQLLQFPCLSTLDCRGCSKLICLPRFPSLDESLSLCNASAKLVVQIMRSSISSSSSSSTDPPLSKLKELRIIDIQDLEYLPAEGLHNLTSLQKLTIENCPKLYFLPHEMPCLPSLRQLKIFNCPRFGNSYVEVGEGRESIETASISDVQIGPNPTYFEGITHQVEDQAKKLDSSSGRSKYSDIKRMENLSCTAEISSSPEDVGEGRKSIEIGEASIPDVQIDPNPTYLKGITDQVEDQEKKLDSSSGSSKHSDLKQSKELPSAAEISSLLSQEVIEHDYSSPRYLKVSDIVELNNLPANLHSLKIEGCSALESVAFENLSCSHSLLHLYLTGCDSFVSFANGALPTPLKTVHIRNCRKLKFPFTSNIMLHQCAGLEHLFIGSSCDSLEIFPLHSFPKLRILCLWDCINLNSISTTQEELSLKSLEALEIKDCPNLVSFQPEVLHAPNLISIVFSNCEKIRSLPVRMHCLISLQSLFISQCPEIASLPSDGLPTSLSLLCIRYCNKITLQKELELNKLNALTHFEIEGGCVAIESFPEEGLLPVNLFSLRISRLLNLEFLNQKGLQELASLETLEISCCKRLRSLPMELPSSLSSLSIKGCPLLKAKLQNKKGIYWSRIVDIPNVYIDDEESE